MSVRLALALMLALLAAGAQAYTLSGKRWSSGILTLQLQLGAGTGTLLDGRTSWNAVAEDALAEWNSNLGTLKFSGVRDSTASIARSNRLNNVFFSGTVYGDAWGTRVLAVTLTQYSSGTLLYAEADVLFNSTLSWNSYRGALRTASNGSRLQDLRRIALHEFGHVLGLLHPDDSGQVVTAIMNSSVSDIDALQSDDIRGGQALYGAPPAPPPVITSQPASQTAYPGSRVSFSVTATGDGPLTYQWRKDGVALAGSTQSSHAILSAATADQGAYTVVVTNSGGSVTSAAAQLTVSLTSAPPSLAVQPVSQTVIAGNGVTFTVVATGTGPLAYQWRRNDVPLTGATGSSLTLAKLAAGDAGAYTVVVSNAAGSVTSVAAILTVAVLPPTLTTSPVAQTAVAGNAVSFSVTAAGTEPLAYQWYRNGAAIPGATTARHTLVPSGSADAGAYAVVVSNAAGTTRSPPADLVVHPASTLANLSVRTNLAPGSTLIVGAVVSGGGKPLLLRAAGPALERFGLAGLADPRLEVYGSGPEPLALNDDWNPSLAPTFTAAAAFAFAPGSRDAALYQSFKDAITAQLRGAGAGTVLVEAYDVSGGPLPRLVNLSTRNRVGTGGDILIAGLALAGTGSKQLLIRAVGPSLAGFLVAGTLDDPVLQVFSAAGTLVAGNDTWDEGLTPLFQRTGAFPLPRGSRDAAVLVTLPAGATYTVHVSGNGGGTGEALLEIYEVF